MLSYQKVNNHISLRLVIILIKLKHLLIQKMSEINKKNRKNKKMMQVTGKKSYARVREELKVLIHYNAIVNISILILSNMHFS